MKSADAAGVILGVIFGIVGLYIAYVLYRKYREQQLERSKVKNVRLSVVSGIKVQHISYDVVNPMYEAHISTRLDDIENHYPMATGQNSKKTNQTEEDLLQIEGDNDNISVDNCAHHAVASNTTHDDDPERFESVQFTEISKSGYLFKKSTSIKKDWLRRWFFIKGGKLFYCHVDSDITNLTSTQAVQVADLVISTVKEISGREFRIISPGSRGSNKGGGVYDLQAESDVEAKDWIRAIRAQIEGSLTQTLKADESPTSSSKSNSIFIVPTAQDIQELHKTNPICADCGSSESVTWASLNLCIMICIECSGIHRSLGTHISKVRSLTLDKWSIYSLQLMKLIGNTKLNTIWEGSLPSNMYKITPTATREQREAYIQDKYVKKLYLAATIRSVDIDFLALKSAATGKVYNLMQAIAVGADLSTTWRTSEVDTKKTPLHMACEGEFILCVELLCINHASVQLIDFDGKQPIDIARDRNRKDMVDLLTYYNKS